MSACSLAIAWFRLRQSLPAIALWLMFADYDAWVFRQHHGGLSCLPSPWSRWLL
jgi:hypothetical protein